MLNDIQTEKAMAFTTMIGLTEKEVLQRTFPYLDIKEFSYPTLPNIQTISTGVEITYDGLLLLYGIDDNKDIKYFNKLKIHAWLCNETNEICFKPYFKKWTF